MSTLCHSPEEAWCDYIGGATPNGWLEDSKEISADINLSKRELFGLILLAYMRNHQHQNWRVGYDLSDPEPNDGFIYDGMSKTFVEHKLIPQMAKESPLEAILSTYGKYAKMGDAYGSNRVLIVFANKASEGMIKISSLRDKIQNKCPFDQVLLINCMAQKDTIAVILISEHYPGNGIAQIDFNLTNGTATVPHCTILSG